MNMQSILWRCVYHFLDGDCHLSLIVVQLQETTLAGNQPLGSKRSNAEDQSKRNSRTETGKFEEPENQLDQTEFYSDDQQINQINETVKEIVAPQVSLEPLQIRTFIATVSWY